MQPIIAIFFFVFTAVFLVLLDSFVDYDDEE